MQRYSKLTEIMLEDQKYWYASWFNTPYYHLLYRDRDHREAAAFMNTLTAHLDLKKNDEILDLACGRGRHSKYLYRQGFDVTGVDLSEESIAYAKEYERERLHFEVHNMLEPYPQKFDAVLNLFTSFGYFEKESDNLRTIRAIKESLKPTGKGVIDFLNAEVAIKNLIPEEQKTIGKITFDIKRYAEGDFIFKEIRFIADGQPFFYTERIMTLSVENFETYFDQAGLNLLDVFGDYRLNSFQAEKSQRLILVFDK